MTSRERGGMTLPFFLEKSGFTGVNCRFRGISGRRVVVFLFYFLHLLWGNAWCRAQSFIEQKASGDCFELIARCLLSSKSERDQIGAALFSLICAR